MKIVKGLAILSFFTVIFGSCFDPPEFPNTPHIELEDLVFVDAPQTDSLILTLTFKDGDGTFEVIGRLDNSDVRGCNLMVE